MNSKQRQALRAAEIFDGRILSTGKPMLGGERPDFLRWQTSDGAVYRVYTDGRIEPDGGYVDPAAGSV